MLVTWILVNNCKVSSLLHYLDDFITAAPPPSPLRHAAKVVWPGRPFLLRMVDLLSCFRRKGHPIWLKKEFHLDLQWWDHLLAQWHDVSFWLYPGLSPVVDLEVASDAAGSLGFGAYFKGF